MPYVGRVPSSVPVTADDIPANSIDASKIVDGSIELAEIADNSITDAKLNSSKLDGIETGATNYIHPTTHATADIADNAITETKIADAAVVSLKSGRKNLIINGGMDVWQRGTSLTSAYRQSTSSGFISDRWLNFGRTSNPFDGDVVKVSDAPTEADATYSLKSTCTDASAFISNSYGLIIHRIEGNNCQHLNSTAYSNISLSFWVKANYTGKHSVNLGIFHATAQTERYHTRYDINSTDTWEKKSITIPLSNINSIGTLNDTGVGLELGFPLGVDSSRFWDTNLDAWDTSETRSAISQTDCKNFFDTVGNTFQITGVQLELGSVATDFEHRSYGEELALCQRYYQRYDQASNPIGFNASGWSDNNHFGHVFLPTTMRVAPTYAHSGVNAWTIFKNGAATASTAVNIYTTGLNYIEITPQFGWASGSTYTPFVRFTGGAWMSLDAEL